MNRSGRSSHSAFKCPRCGCSEWGSSYNFDGPGDTPVDPKATGLDQGGRSVRFEGTFTRMCHGYVHAPDGDGYKSCGYRWNSKDDAKHGIEPPSQSNVHGWAPPKEPAS
jgi:hypothetical protein